MSVSLLIRPSECQRRPNYELQNIIKLTSKILYIVKVYGIVLYTVLDQKYIS